MIYDYQHTESLDAPTLTDTQIARCEDPEVLCKWLSGLHSLNNQLRARVESYKFCEVGDTVWLERVAGKLGWLRVGIRAVELRMRELGIEIPALPADPRVVELKRLNKVVQRQRNALRAAGVDPDTLGEG